MVFQNLQCSVHITNHGLQWRRTMVALICMFFYDSCIQPLQQQNHNEALLNTHFRVKCWYTCGLLVKMH